MELRGGQALYKIGSNEPVLRTPILTWAVGNSVGNGFQRKRKGPVRGLKSLLLLGGRWATRTPDLWFRRPTLYPTELIARVFKYYHMTLPCQGNWQEATLTAGILKEKFITPRFPRA